MKEKPFLVCPPIYEEGPAVCVGCCLNLDGNGKKCPECHWPMCGQEKCWGEGSQHKLGECFLLMKADRDHVTAVKYRQGITTAVHKMILVLRALALRERNPAKFGKLMDFTFRGPDRPSMMSPVFLQLVEQLLPKEWAVPVDVLNRICCIFHANSMNIIQLKPESPKVNNLFNIFKNRFKRPALNILSHLQGIFFVTNMIEHACLPNASLAFYKEGEMFIRTTVPLRKGAKILLNHEIGVFAGTIERQSSLKKRTRFYSCDCQRCRDPTELGTFVSGIYCRKCPDQEGIILSESPLDEHAEWVCNMCFDRNSPDSIGLVFKVAADEWGALNHQSIPEMEGFLNKFAKVLHPNFFLMTNVKIALIALYDLVEPDNAIEASYAKGITSFFPEFSSPFFIVSNFGR